MSRTPLDKIEVLDSIEKDIILCLQSAGEITGRKILVFLTLTPIFPQVKYYKSSEKINPV